MDSCAASLATAAEEPAALASHAVGLGPWPLDD